MPRVSVIVPTHNCAGYLSSCIESALSQSFRDFELIIVDDGSDDDTAGVIETYRSERRLLYIRKEKRGGLPSARNSGIAIARGDLIALLDADDVFLEEKLAKQVFFMDKNKKYGISYTNEVYYKEDTGAEVLSGRYRFTGDVFYFLKRCNFITASTIMIRSGIMRANLFNESLEGHEDWEMLLRIAAKDVRFGYINEPLSRIMVRGTSMTMKSDTMAETRSEVGTMARAYWKAFKRDMGPFSLKGLKAMIRYLNFKSKALLVDSAWKESLKKPVPQELL